MPGIKVDATPLNPIYLEMGAAVQDSQRLELYISFIVTLLIDLSGGTLSDAPGQSALILAQGSGMCLGPSPKSTWADVVPCRLMMRPMP